MKNISNKIRRKVSRIIYNKPNFETYFNVPIKYNVNGKYGINEKLIEWPFVFNNIKDIEKPKKIVDVSHFGAYGERYNPIELSKVIIKIHELLKENGNFIVATPVGEHSIDVFERSFGH